MLSTFNFRLPVFTMGVAAGLLCLRREAFLLLLPAGHWLVAWPGSHQDILATR